MVTILVQIIGTLPTAFKVLLVQIYRENRNGIMTFTNLLFIVISIMLCEINI